MSDAVLADTDTAGALLRQAREAAGLHVAALAVSLKVPVRKLEALEADRYDELTDAVFARALAFSVCRTLKVDATPILERLPQSSAPRLVHDRTGINEPFRAPGDPATPSWADQLTRPVPLAVFGLLLGALVLVFLPGVRRDETAGSKTEPTAPVTGMTTPALPPLSAPPEPVQTPAPGAAESAPPTPAIALQASDVVVFRTSGPSWIEVVDARGNVALRRLLAAGEAAGAGGPTPLSVTVGSAGATTVQVRGKPFALAPSMVKDNVARFEIK